MTELRVLLLEDNTADADLAVRELSRSGLAVSTLRVDTEDEYMQALKSFAPGLILSDFSLPGFDGLSALQLTRSVSLDVPFVFLSGTIGEERAVEAMRRGATDYVLKDRLERLGPVVKRALQEADERKARRQAELELATTKERLDGILASLVDIVWSRSIRPTRLLYLNPAAESIFDRSVAEFQHDPELWFEIIHPDDRERVAAHWKRALQGEVFDVEYRIVRKEGGIRWIHDRARPVRDAAGNAARFDGLARDITERKTHEEKLHYLAYYDVLTGLSNRHLLEVQLARQLAYDLRHELGLTVLSVDLDNFKVINDSLGHNVGDALLKAVAQRLLACVSSDDIVARYGSDAFSIVLVDQRNAADASRVIQRVLSSVAEPIHIEGREFHVTCSIGASLFPQDGADPAILLRNADAALHRAKELGRNGFQFYAEEMNSAVTERLLLDAALRRALERQELTLQFQPQVSLRDGHITGFEALLRWKHPERGAVSPVKFIPILEENGLIVDVGDWVFSAACEQIKTWQKQGLAPLPIAVNLSARQLHQIDLDRRIERTLSGHGVDPSLIEVEITESVLMRNAEQVVGILRGLRRIGIRLSVDDFGTGYSSLAYLRSFPLDSLKVDRSFISDVTTNTDAALIVQAVISMAHHLRLKVIAEGVETAAQAAFLAASGCEEMQGYYFSRPADADGCTRLLRERHTMDMAFITGASGAPT
jgi:diguanylate cyclase (GGDEF)-like protein/PAS domain S-box-containing protein